jgi:hypothetical protein
MSTLGVGELSRGDIEGRRLVDLLQTPWESIDDFAVSRVLVQLDTGTLFELVCGDTDERTPLRSIAPNSVELLKVDWAYAPEGCIGEIVTRVVRSEFWPCIGVLLQSKRIVYCADLGTPFRVGALITRLGEKYTPEEVFDYWTGQPLG